MGVDNYSLLNEKREVICTKHPNSCFACFSTEYYDGPSKKDKKATHFIRVEVDSEVSRKFFNSPLIQGLIPGAERLGEYELLIPTRETPFDQVICALRLLKYDSLKEVLKFQNGINNDGIPLFIGYTVEMLKGFLEAHPRFNHKDYNSNDIVTSASLSEYCRRYFGGNFFYANASSYIRLLNGEFNPGVLPPYHECFGYQKYYYLVNGAWEGEHKFTMSSQHDIGKYYKDTWLTINHPLILWDEALTGELKDSFPPPAGAFPDALKDRIIKYLEDVNAGK